MHKNGIWGNADLYVPLEYMISSNQLQIVRCLCSQVSLPNGWALHIYMIISIRDTIFSKFAFTASMRAAHTCTHCTVKEFTRQHKKLLSIIAKGVGIGGKWHPRQVSIKDAIYGSFVPGDSKLRRKAIQAVLYVLVWSIWKGRNRVGLDALAVGHPLKVFIQGLMAA
ncbi:hypothetical protein Tco_0422589 [Tanacetum coccineum]